MPGDLHSRFAASFARFADRPLVEAHGRTFTYAEIEALSARLATRLCELGVAPGERVLVQTAKSVETLALYFAVVRTGAIYLPLNTDYTEAELDYFAGDATPVLAVCREGDEALFALIGKGGVTVTTLATLFNSLPDEADPPASRAPDDIVAILYTSGTTGKPKGATLTQRNLAANGETLIELWRFTEEDRLIHALPIFHVHGLFVAVHCVLFSGSSMVFLDKFESGAVIDLMAHSTVLMGVPTFYNRLLSDERFTQRSAANMRLF
ncbi:MAG: AMP-binding protein, partial [Alphaproteobacteria bacterium]|nr:AMP-binding protein [Alphaproteobacteria bacterium]